MSAAKLKWWIGSNGATFADYNNSRFCITKNGPNDYYITENGNEIAEAPNMAEAKLFISRYVEG